MTPSENTVPPKRKVVLSMAPSARFPMGRGKCRVCGEPKYRECLCRVHLYEMRRSKYKELHPSCGGERCVTCGVDFEKTNPRHRYCSQKCRDRARLKRDRKYPVPGPEKKKCKQCGTSFSSKSPIAVYCSKKCKDRGRAIRRQKGRSPVAILDCVCEWCSKEFQQPKRYYIGKNKNRTPKFCSADCHYRYKRELRGKPVDMTWKCWQSASKGARERDMGKCCICGSLESGSAAKKNMSVDHIIPRRLMAQWGMDMNHMENLACICIPCHAKKTAAEIKIFEGKYEEFIDRLAQIGYPLIRVVAAFAVAELSGRLVEEIYRGECRTS
jgi:hypothetical protein